MTLRFCDRHNAIIPAGSDLCLACQREQRHALYQRIAEMLRAAPHL